MVRLATTDAMISGGMRSATMEPNTISATKKAPAIGALYTEVIPAAAPHATRVRICSGEIVRKRPTKEAQRAASCTMGPSCPIEEPVAIEHSEDELRASVCRTGIRPSPKVMASM